MTLHNDSFSFEVYEFMCFVLCCMILLYTMMSLVSKCMSLCVVLHDFAQHNDSFSFEVYEFVCCVI